MFAKPLYHQHDVLWAYGGTELQAFILCWTDHPTYCKDLRGVFAAFSLIIIVNILRMAVVHECMYVDCICAWYPWRLEQAHLELEPQVFVSAGWVLGEPLFFARAGGALNH